MDLVGHYNYWVAILLMIMGFYVVIAAGNLVKKLIGLSIFQTSVLLFYTSIGKIDGSVSPILREGAKVYTNPIPHVLMLTAIVVGIATLSVGLALAIRIKGAYGTVEESEVVGMDNAVEISHYREAQED